MRIQAYIIVEFRNFFFTKMLSSKKNASVISKFSHEFIFLQQNLGIALFKIL